MSPSCFFSHPSSVIQIDVCLVVADTCPPGLPDRKRALCSYLSNKTPRIVSELPPFFPRPSARHSQGFGFRSSLTIG